MRRVEQNLETLVVLYFGPSLFEKLQALHIGGRTGRFRKQPRLKLLNCGHRNIGVAETNHSLCSPIWQLNDGLLQCCIRRGGVPLSKQMPCSFSTSFASAWFRNQKRGRANEGSYGSMCLSEHIAFSTPLHGRAWYLWPRQLHVGYSIQVFMPDAESTLKRKTQWWVTTRVSLMILTTLPSPRVACRT